LEGAQESLAQHGQPVELAADSSGTEAPAPEVDGMLEDEERLTG
jgi:hypothetical protein